ncbi:methylthioribulose 1-phosphate dehydratase [Calothrix sp. 336/3]|uniref:methylthioribulose 1-phosphate dehydratase n=1 Tax=Calothrix sp. 336/3 TaxID=1337936 RepID=UPI0004E3ACF6|nr:methylthioribulose 1-phosphate dehydratase [Calothrix sp. 336/3]AKG20783.1 methylthioribulose-1-phosphate dehydratase [Calothrix sp. 336/3]
MNNQVSADERIELITAARLFYQRGWMVGTAGNLSLRLEDGSFWITASGKAKGELTTRDFVRVYADSTVEAFDSDLKPSAETSIHQTIYTLFPQARACYHVHSIEANLVSMFAQEDILHLPPLEMLKGLGVWEENPQCHMAVFNNYLDVPKIASEIEARFRNHLPQIPALLIRNHGVTVWASSPAVALNYIELVEYVFRYMVAAHQVK